MKKFYPELESARGIAALLVAFFHAGQTSITVNGGPSRVSSRVIETDPFWRAVEMVYEPVTGGGIVSPIHPAVLFFFVLSGFVLAKSLEEKSDVSRFAVSRIFRIYPAAAASVAAFCFLFFATGLAISPTAYSPGSIVANLLLLKTSINGVLWAIQNELLAAPFVLVGFLINRKVGLWALAIVTGALMLAAPWDPARAVMALIGGPTRVGWMWSFLLGMCAYYAGSRWRPALPPMAALVAILGLLLVFFSSYAFTPINHPSKQIVEATSAAVIVALLAFGPATAANGFLNLPAIRFYGRISYSFYVVHPLTLTVMFRHPEIFSPMLDYMPRTALGITLGIVSTALVTPLAWLSYRFVERPGIAAGRYILDGLRAVPAPTSRPARARIVLRRSERRA